MKTEVFLIIPFFLILSPIAANYPQWENYTSGNSITCIAEEGDFLWVGTTGGLVKINKITREPVFFSKLTSGLPSNYIWSIAIDTQGVKWIGTSQGLARFDGTHWKTFTTENSLLPHNNIFSLEIDSKGAKWIGTKHGLALLDSENWTVYNKENTGFDFSSVISITTHPDGRAWACIAFNNRFRLVAYDNGQWSEPNLDSLDLDNNDVDFVSVDSKGELFFCVRHKGLFCYDGVAWKLFWHQWIPGAGFPNINSIAFDRNNNKWMSTSYGLLFLSNTDTAIFSPPDSITFNKSIGTQPIFADNEGRVWTGLLAKGLFLFEQPNWTKCRTSNTGLPDASITGIALDPKGRKWLSTSMRGLVRFDGVHWDNYTTDNSGLSSNILLSISINSYGAMWINTLTVDGSFEFDGTKILNVSKEHRFLAFGPNGGVWGAKSISNLKQTLQKREGDTWINVESYSSPVTSYRILYDVAWDSKSVKWLGTDKGLWRHAGGVSKIADTSGRISGQNQIEAESELIGMPSRSIYTIAIDSKDVLWAGTNNGLVRYDGVNWKNYNQSNSLLADSAILILEIDSKGNKWIGSKTAGLYKFDGIEWTNFNINNSGLLDNDIEHIFIDADESIWIGTLGGLSVFRENKAPIAQTHHGTPLGREHSIQRFRRGIIINKCAKRYTVHGKSIEIHMTK